MGEFLLVILVALYFVPTICAGVRDSKSTGPIAVLNILFGWTVIVWIVCFIWAFSSAQNTPTRKTINKKSNVFCVKCGNQVPDDFKFCNKCGNSIS